MASSKILQLVQVQYSVSSPTLPSLYFPHYSNLFFPSVWNKHDRYQSNTSMGDTSVESPPTLSYVLCISVVQNDQWHDPTRNLTFSSSAKVVSYRPMFDCYRKIWWCSFQWAITLTLTQNVFRVSQNKPLKMMLLVK